MLLDLTAVKISKNHTSSVLYAEQTLRNVYIRGFSSLKGG